MEIFSRFVLQKTNKTSRYNINTVSGKTVGRISKRYVKPGTNVEIRRGSFHRRVWSRGWTVTWVDSGEREAFERLSEVAAKYTFANYPGPNGVLARSEVKK